VNSQTLQKSTHTAGVTLVVLSALVFSTAGLFTKGVQAGAWDIIFWRGIFAALFTSLYTIWRGSFRIEFVEMGRSGWAAALVGASATAAFIPAFKFTTIANVSLIYAATPLFAAALSWMWVGERATKLVLAGCVAALCGVGLIVSGSIGAINLKGDLLACWMALAMAIMFVIYQRYPKTPAAGPAALSSIVLLPVALMLGVPFANLLHEVFIMVAFGLVFALASVTLSEGAKRLPAGETALLSLLEVPIAPLLAWLIFAEYPALTTFIGGALILAGVLGTQLLPSKIRSEV
jgi:drug/metabolite transporter (DMT)-like permease